MSPTEFRSLPAEYPAVRRFVEELWLPYHRDLSERPPDFDGAE